MKNFLISFACIIICIQPDAQVAGPSGGSSFSNATLAGSSQSWVNNSNSGVSDNFYATFGDLTGPIGSYTDYLVVTNFGYSIPPGSVINGIQVDVERSDVSSRTFDYSIRIVKGGVVAGTEHSIGDFYSSTTEFEVKDNHRVFGNGSDLWGETWVTTDINAPGFGVAIAAQRGLDGGMTDGRIDDVRITIFYTLNLTLPVKLVSFTAEPKDNRVRLVWKTSEESGMDRYEVQRSGDGAVFTSFGTLISDNRSSGNEYAFNDYSPLPGTTYYRLKMMDNNRKVSYSKIISIQFHSNNVTTLFPNPWKKSEALFIRNPNNEKLSVVFYNSVGERVSTTVTTTTEVSNEKLSGTKGIVLYKVFNGKNALTGSGTLMVQ